MDKEPLAAGPRLHSSGSAERVSLEKEIEAIIGFEEVTEAEFEEVVSPTQKPIAAPQGTAVVETNEATEVAANALITLFCVTHPGEPDMAYTGTVRAAIGELAKALASPTPDFTATQQMLDLITCADPS